jgi:hypothetical protein
MIASSGESPPALFKRSDGETRRIGVELEFSGLDIESSATLVQKEFGGEVDRISAYESKIRGTEFGDFQVELDFALLKQIGRDSADKNGDDSSDQIPERLLATVAEQLVPFEIVTPPLPMDRLHELEALIGRLRQEGARGTRHSAIYAFGLHLNPEMPDLEAETILAYLQAFACLYPWLVRVGEIDWSRRFTVYIQPFPSEYVRRIIDRDYAPGIETLIDDYLQANPARNRALDMLPLFAHIDEKRVRAAVDDDRIKPRPALHYRLPNCEIDLGSWSVDEPWRHWLQVEHLAHDRRRLKKMCRGYCLYLDNPVRALLKDWSKRCERWLIELDDDGNELVRAD